MKVEFFCCDGRELVPELVEFFREAHLESRFGYVPFSEKKAIRIIKGVMDDPNKRTILIAKYDGRIVGGAYCSVGEYFLGVGVLISTIHAIYTNRGIRGSLLGGRVSLGLFRGVQTWSESRNVSEIHLHATSGIQKERIHKLSPRIGYSISGVSYVRETSR